MKPRLCRKEKIPNPRWGRFPRRRLDEEGAVLVISMWILIILTLLALSAGRRTSIELKLLRHHLHRAQAFYLSKAGLERIYAEKKGDENGYDALNEEWSNKLKAGNEPEFKDFAFANGKFTVRYDYFESLDEEPQALYGMQDEQSKLNINKILDDADSRAKEFKALLETVLKSNADAQALVDKFLDWIDSDNAARPKGREDYSGPGITPKNKPLERLEELLMIEGFTPEIVSKLVNYITIYGDGTININSAPREIFLALGLSEEAARRILSYRLGSDGRIATADDGIMDDISDLPSIFSIGALSAEDTGIINNLINTRRISVNSSAYRTKSYGTVYNVSREIASVAEIKPGENPRQLYWYED